MKLCNVKISLHFENDLFGKEKSNRKIFKHVRSWTITQYCSTPSHVHVTGIKSMSEIDDAVQVLESMYNQKCLKVNINSMLHSHKDTKNLKFDTILEQFDSKNGIFYIDFQPELFTGAFLKPYDRSYPTIILFYTGSFQLIGGSDFQKVQKSQKFVEELITKCVDGARGQ